MYAVPQFEVSPGAHAWLTEHLFVARGRLAGRRQIEYEIFRVGAFSAGSGCARHPLR
jgi:uncharacterized protein DUF3237